MAIHINRLNGGNITIGTAGGGGASEHHDTWYKYAGDSDWRTISISNSIDGAGEDVPTNQIPNVTNIVELEIGTDVTRIGDFAFEDCVNLISIIIPNTVTQIKGYSFCNTGISNVIIPDNVTEIGLAAFSNCQHLTMVSIGNGITTLYQSIFSGCSSLTSITIPDSVTSIGSNAFDYCSGLTNVTIPDSVTSIREYAFDGCSALTTVTIVGNGGNAENVKQMMISAGVSSNITWNMPS